MKREKSHETLRKELFSRNEASVAIRPPLDGSFDSRPSKQRMDVLFTDLSVKG